MTRPLRDTEKKASIETSRAQKALLVFFGLGLLILGFALVEGALALFDLGVPDSGVGIAPGNDLFERDGALYRTRPEKLAFFNEQSFAATKDPGTLRVFALGGSTTAGRPYDWRAAFPRWLELFARQRADRPVEVINAGGISYASYRITVLMEELLRYRPDVFLIYTGHNEFLEERTYSEILHEAAWQRRFRGLTRGLRSFTLARRALHSERRDDPGLAPEVRAKLDVWNGLDLFERDDELERSVLAHYEQNLRRMLEMADSRGVRTVLVRPISNLKDFSPFKSQHDASLDPERIATADRLLEEGKSLLEGSLEDAGSLDAGSLEDAVERLEEAFAADPLYAETSYRLGRALLAAGRFQEAEKSFIHAKDEDVCPLRMLSAADRLLVAVARETETPLVDLPSWAEKENRRLTGHGIWGKELLLDHVHPTMEVHRQIAEASLDVLEEMGELRLREASLEPVVREALQDLDEVYYARRDLNLSKVLGWAGKYEEALEPLERAVTHLYDDPEVFRNLGIVYQKVGRTGDALQAHQRAVELDDSIPESHFNLGVVFGQLGRWQRSAEALERALALRPDYPEARFNLGVARGRLVVREAKASIERGDLDGAEAAYVRALGLDESLGGQKRIHNDLGVLHARRGRIQEAEEILRRALEIDPDYAEARFNLGLVLGNAGRLEESRRELEAALALEPENPRFRAALGRLPRSANPP